MKRVLIIGSSGMLGVDLSRELCSSYEVIGADMRRVQGLGSRVQKFYKADITDKKSILRVVRKADPDIVIHAAAMTDVDG